MEDLKKILSGIKGIINFYSSQLKTEKEKSRKLRQKIRNLKNENKKLREGKNEGNQQENKSKNS